MKDVKSVLIWAKEHGEVKVIDRILVKVMLPMIKHKITLTSDMVQSSGRIDIPDELYLAVRQAAEAVVGKTFAEK